MSVKLVNDSTAILSMRDTDFDTYSAFGEPIDNSIQADAKNIDLLFDIRKDGHKEIIKELAFIDDGHGMTKDVLHQCMQLGFSSRFNDRTGIGRFGVGMTLAAIHECKKIEVYSKVRGGQWNYTYVDVDAITSDPPKMDSIPDPYNKKLPTAYEKYDDYESGTILIWKKYDRLKDSVKKVLEESEIWIGRTYRYFIWEGISIRINKNEVKAIDPLYVNMEKTRFPEDPPAEEFPPKIKEFEIPEDACSEKVKEKIKIRSSLLDETLRAERQKGGEKRIRQRYIDRNQGISIIRNRREVFYGEIPYWTPKFIPKDRWWGFEISFPAELDSLFAVKNIKRGALPVYEMKDYIENTLNPFRKTMWDRIQQHWDLIVEKEEEEKKQIDSEAGVSTKHTKATNIAGSTPKKKSKIDKNKDSTEAITNFIKKYYDDFPKEKLKNLVDYFTNSEYIIDEKSWNSPNFVSIEHLVGRKAIIYNRSHPFFKRYFNLINMIEDFEPEKKLLSEGIITLIDLIILSYSIAESMYEPEDSWQTEDLLEDLKIRWGSELRNLFNTWERNYEQDKGNINEE